MTEGDRELVAPPLPVRASIYIAPDGTVHFGALFAELVPVATALGGATGSTKSAAALCTFSSAPTNPSATSSSIASG